MSNPIALKRTGNVLVARFIRPDVRNALSTGVLSELENLLTIVEHDETVEKLIFTGMDGIFASGADLREIAALGAEDAAAFARRGQAIMGRISDMGTRTAAAINGLCFGGALDLALACSTRVAVPAATFCHPGAGLGIITGWGGTQRLPRLVGEATALLMFYTATPITAAEALRIGLVDSVVDDPLSGFISHSNRQL